MLKMLRKVGEIIMILGALLFFGPFVRGIGWAALGFLLQSDTANNMVNYTYVGSWTVPIGAVLMMLGALPKIFEKSNVSATNTSTHNQPKSGTE